jgi:hypothetical protein
VEGRDQERRTGREGEEGARREGQGEKERRVADQTLHYTATLMQANVKWSSMGQMREKWLCGWAGTSAYLDERTSAHLDESTRAYLAATSYLSPRRMRYLSASTDLYSPLLTYADLC